MVIINYLLIIKYFFICEPVLALMMADAFALIADPKIKSHIRQRGYKRQSLTKTLYNIGLSRPDTESDLNFYIEKLSEIRTTINLS